MSLIGPEKIRHICDGVWHDRAAILTARGVMSGEDALVGAVYWRLCKAGRQPGESIADLRAFLARAGAALQGRGRADSLTVAAASS